ncbi:MAG TPA: hypothetical protein VIV54_04585 [Burkholderiales bacterium]
MALALKTLGTKEKLATALGVLLLDLEGYLAEPSAMPQTVFLDLLEIVSRGPVGLGR